LNHEFQKKEIVIVNSFFKIVFNVDTSITSCKFEIKYIHHHILSFETSNIENSEVVSNLQNFINIIIVNSFDKLRSSHLVIIDNNDNSTFSSFFFDKELIIIKIITINDYNIIYDANTFSDSSFLQYKMNQLEKLIKN